MRPGESFVTQPVRSLQTMLRVLAEDDNTLPTVVPDGIYGPSTMQAIATFQRKTGLPSTGITNQETWEAVVQAYEPARIRVDQAAPIEIVMDPGQIFRRGDSSPYIYLLQSILIQLANDHQSISAPMHNGVLDDLTAQALVDYQILAALPQTGELDKVTWYHIVKHYTANNVHNDVTQNPEKQRRAMENDNKL